MTDKRINRVLAVDGGGTKTIARIANVMPSQGQCSVALEVIGQGHAGASNPRSVGFDVAFENLELAISEALDRASIDPCSVAVACISLAGAGRIEEQDLVRKWADSKKIAEQIVVTDDVVPLRLAAMYEQDVAQSAKASNWEQCVTLVVGTGSIACGIDQRESSARAGGWGYLLGDEGSGFAMGLAGLRVVCQAHDRGQATTVFQQELLSKLGLCSPKELIPFIYQSQIPRAEVAGLCEIVMSHAELDPEAGRIVDDAIKAMAQLVTTIVRRLKLSQLSYSLALSGGVLINNPLITSRILQELQQKELAPLTSHVVSEPIHGPLLMAAQLL